MVDCRHEDALNDKDCRATMLWSGDTAQCMEEAQSAVVWALVD